jgi:5-methylcytosine-specific restriction endonuclease McrA
MGKHHRKYRGVSKLKRVRVYAKTGGFCWYCGDPASTIDHIHPRSRKNRPCPRNHELNLLPACEDCNTKKKNYTLQEYRYRKANGKVWRFWGEKFLPLPLSESPKNQ